VNKLLVDDLLRSALIEDIGAGDITTGLVPGGDRTLRAVLKAKADGVLCGGVIAARCFTLLDPGVQVTLKIDEGEYVDAGESIGQLSGRAASLLTAERVALNFVQRLSGIATMARRMAERAAPLGIRIVETRKTTPGLRMLEKYAVRIGGGYNHRFDLSSAVMLKDNHFAASGVPPVKLVQDVRRQAGHTVMVLAEALTPLMAADLAGAGADVVLLDNFAPEEVRQAVALIAGRCTVEVSGGVSEANLGAYLIPGVNVISVGALTHSYAALDISLEF
jgi:nicotinate-nucleotide pyrophosphorylase (carboxylating)